MVENGGFGAGRQEGPPPAGDPETLARRLLQVWDDAAEAILALDTDWHYRYANRAARTLLHLHEDVIGRDSREVHPDASASPFGAVYRRVMKSRVAETTEHHYEPLDTYLRAIIRPWPDGIVITLIDVTAQRRPQARLQRDLALYQQLLAHTTQAITLRDLAGRILLVNNAAAARMGRPVDELIGLTPEDVFTPDVAKAIRATDRHVVQSGVPQENVVAHELYPGRKVVPQIFPVRDADGRMVGLGSTVTDVTELSEAQAELAASQNRFRKVFGSTSLGILVLSGSGRVIEANSAVCRLLGYSRAALLGMTGLDLVGASSPDLDARRDRLRTEAHEGYEIEEEFVRSDGQRIPVLLTVNSFSDPANRGRLFSVVVRDLTVLHQLQERVLAAVRMEAVGRLAAGIAHDANNILAGVSGYAELLAAEVADRPAAGRHLAGIHRSVQRAGDMVERLMAVSRGTPVEPTIVDLADVVRDLTDMLRRLVPAGISLSVVAEPAVALADVSQIRQIVLNLVVNARNALGASGTISITTGRALKPGTPPQSVLTVTDDGPGMDSDVARQCFEPFFTTREGIGGSGLGLSTAREIARRGGGDLRVATELGAGTTFTLCLPAADVANDDQSVRPDGGTTVLVVDDDADVLDLMATALAQDGFQVSRASSAREATATGLSPDLLVADIDMPGGSGVDLARQLRRQRPGLPVLLVSGAPRPGTAEGMHFLPKPFTRAELRDAVFTALAGRT